MALFISKLIEGWVSNQLTFCLEYFKFHSNGNPEIFMPTTGEITQDEESILANCKT